jgi:hypothetical protein
MAKTLNIVSNTSHAAQSVMARILATENIKVVVDQKMQTAAFDLKNRTLLLPQWKDMSKVVYDMLIGHEISHALHTPADGWRSTCEKIGGTTDTSSKAYQTASLYLNVVEDARIERLIQVKFPGFRRDFIGAYNELNTKNFFGVKGVDMNTLSLADRINLYYKLGTIGSVGINFTTAEDQFIRRIDSATTFADAAQIAEDLFRYCNEQQHKNQPQQQQQNGNGSPNKPCNNGKDDKSQGDKSKQGEPRGDSDTSDTKDGSRGDQGGEEKRDGAGDDAQDGGDQSDQQGKQPADSNDDQKSKQSGPVGSQHSQSDVPPTPMTQKSLNDNLQNQVQRDQYAKDVVAPTQLVHCNLDNVIIDCKKIVEAKRKDFPWMTNTAERTNGGYINHDAIVNKTTKDLADFMRSSKKQIDLLMKQFELRKAAQIAKRESVRKTGMLDTVRMVNYKHSEDIFRRNTMLPEGKNHGLVMFVDWSGSMSQCLAAVMEQTMVLVEFCRRMNIPYDVYAFTTRSFETGVDANGWNPSSVDPADLRKKMWKGAVNDNYTKDTQEEVMSNGYESPRSHNQFSLLNLFSSRLNRTEHQEMMLFLRALVSRPYEVTSTFHANARWELSGTALDESIVAAMQIVPQFKEANKLDIVNTIFLTDGETSVPYLHGCQLIDPKSKAVYSGEQFYSEEERAGGYVDHYGQSTNILLLALRDITKSNVVGMFLTGSAAGINVNKCFRKELRRQTNMLMAGKSVKDKYAQMHCEREARKIVASSLGKQFNEDNCVVAEAGTTGYSEYFIIKSTTRVLGTEDAMDEVQQGATQAAIKKAFLKSFDNKNKSRVLINRFIELIAR